MENWLKLKGYGFMPVTDMIFLVHSVKIDFSAIDPEQYLSYAIKKVYDAGVEWGEFNKAKQIRDALYLPQNIVYD